MLRLLLIAQSALSTVFTLSFPAPHFAEQRPLDHDKTNYAPDHLGAVASENSICSQIGIDLLKEGGNAADALVGTVFCVGVIGMYHSGIGGGGFMLVRGSDGQYEDIDFRETAPASYFQDMYNDEPIKSVLGGLARYD
jgi:gamma-glutamyltranspeptidase / glutathione hydrolase